MRPDFLRYQSQVGNGGMDPFSSLYIIPNSSLHNPFPHSLLRTRQSTPVFHRAPLLHALAAAVKGGNFLKHRHLSFVGS